MAEKVQREMEIILTEVEEMNRTKLFTPEETREILKKRKTYEYKMSRATKNCKDIIDYIGYESDILKTLYERRQKNNIPERRSNIDVNIRKRIHKLYDLAAQRFPDNHMLLVNYFLYGKQNFPIAADHAIIHMLRKHPNVPKYWVIAAKWYAFDKGDFKLAMHTLDKARAINKGTSEIVREMIDLEIARVSPRNQAPKREETEDDKLMKVQCVKRLLIYLDYMFEDVKDVESYFDLLKSLQQYTYTTEVQIKIVDHLINNYSEIPEVWHELAQREKDGYHHKPPLSSGTRVRLRLCFAKYQEGFDKVPKEAKKELWTMYVDFLVELLHDDFSVANTMKTESLKAALVKGDEECCLQERHYLKWMEICPSELDQILEKGTTSLPRSIELWKMRITRALTRYGRLPGKVDDINNLFKTAIDSLKEDGLPVWQAMIRYKTMNASDEDISKLYEEAMEECDEFAEKLKGPYLEWIAFAYGVEQTRIKYWNIVRERPFSKELHFVMCHVEESEIDINYEKLEEVHRLAVEQFGASDERVWFNYIMFYHNFNKRHPNAKEMIRTLYKEAEEKLPLHLFIDFRDKVRKIGDTGLNI